MQFKHPEVFYFLFLLLIPIIVHLFQLQKFKKVTFTNVAFLQQISLQNRKSSQLKKWLILGTRLLSFLAILFVFSQPFFSSKELNESDKIFIYLDNSASVNSMGKKGNLFTIAKQEIIQNTKAENIYFLLTNDNFYKNLSKKDLEKTLKNTYISGNKLSKEQIELFISQQNKNKTNNLNKIILLSDFQLFTKNKNKLFTNVKSPIFAKKLTPELQENLSIDDVSILSENLEQLIVTISVKNQGAAKNNIPIALYNNSKLLNKRSFSIDENSTKKIDFTIQKQANFKGEIRITFSDTFNFDNQLLFAFESNEKIDVLSIGKPSSFLPRIYTSNEFNFKESSLQNVNYNAIEKQALIILNELEDFPKTLQNSLLDFLKNGGSLIVIPNEKINTNSFNQFFTSLNLGKIQSKSTDSLQITNINEKHPIYTGVFSKKINNFQYPVVTTRFESNFKASDVIKFADNTGFLKDLNVSNGAVFWFASPLNLSNTNFSNSPLIVPTLYNIGMKSLQVTQPFYRLGTENKIDITAILQKDDILTMNGNNTSFIPLQQSFTNRVSITTNKQPFTPGFYEVTNKKNTLKTLAFNYPKTESSLEYLDVSSLDSAEEHMQVFDSVSSIFKEINEENEVQWLWKLFLAIAIVSLLLEILILKFFNT